MSAHPFAGPALAMLDIGDVPRGLRALDLLAKEAQVEILAAGTVQAGDYLILFGGQVEPVQRSYERALEVAAGAVRDCMLLPFAEERIAPAVLDAARRWPCPGDTLGVIQTSRPPTILKAVDAALKGALVDLVELRVAEGLGGKAIATLWGEAGEVEAEIELAERAIQTGCSAGSSTSIIPRADDETARAINPSTHFYQGWRG